MSARFQCSISNKSRFRRIATTCLVITLSACSKESSESKESKSETPAPSASSSPTPTGRVISIEMITDEKGSYFKPNEVEAKPGDVLKFVLTAGVHNVHFLPDSNPGVSNLPEASQFAQLPGQAIDVPVTMAAGQTYYFQCDPHAALGMKGHLKVESN